MSFSKNLSVVVLAAGKGKRMKSEIPKVLHQICGKPMLYYILSLAGKLNPKNIFAVIGYKRELVSDYIKINFPEVKTIIQKDQLGTAHAVSMLKKQKEDLGKNILILPGDCPLIDVETLRKLIENKIDSGSAVCIITSQVPDPEGYGRIIKDKKGSIVRIVEETDASPDEKKINEVNSSFYYFDTESLFKNIEEINTQNTQQEYYLTDIIEVLIKNGEEVCCFEAADYMEVMGINDRIQLNRAENIMLRKISEDLMKNGAIR